jgi:N-acetylated-alpha-linked acidic dipeptidase
VKTLAALLASTALFAQAPIRGFPRNQWESQHALEEKLRALPEPERARTYMKRMAAEPHAAGSAASKAVAEYALGLFREWGLDAKIEEFEALLPYPTHRTLEMTAPVRYRAKLAEPRVGHDPDSGDSGQLPAALAYAASGDVSAPLVYVNYGVPEDYAVLDKLGVSVKGKIVLARYGKSWRGTKVKVAQERGALGCIIYSDPRDDGYWQGDVFPAGPYRPEQSVQRGSVVDMPLYVGDPLSPGWASEKGSKRLNREEAASLMKIPALPISWGDAKPLLEQLRGPVAPPEWRGALPLTYHIGPGPATVRLKVDYDHTTKPMYNVIARIPGSAAPDEWIIYGNHHDAWVNGAADPVSGAVALLETARSFAELRKQGWQPKRTLIFALWDGEEFGLMGSTEWVEKHRAELQRKTVAYLNSDTNTGGKLGAGGTALLEVFLREVIRDVRDPKSGKTLLETETPKDGASKRGAQITAPLGAGSDYVAFLHHAGIASLNLGFGQPGANGTYHSIYDSYAWYAEHMDKDFAYSRTLAQVKATAMIRLSEAAILPFEFGALSDAAREWIGEIAKSEAGRKAKIDFSALEAELGRLSRAAIEYEKRLAAALSGDSPGGWNAALLGAERTLTDERGHTGRPWYKHQLTAPGIYTGYSARTLPAVREALEAGRIEEAGVEAKALEAPIRRLRELIERLGAANR